MSNKTHTIVRGDTLSALALKYYGDPSLYQLIFDASNFRSGDPDLIFPGEVAIIPDRKIDTDIENETYREITPPVPDDIKNASPDEVFLTIDNELFTGWEGLTISKNIDTCADAFSFDVAFDADNEKLREVFRPFRYRNCKVYAGNELQLNGFISKINPSLDGDDNKINIQGVSNPGILVTSSIDTYPLQFFNLTLSKIAEQVCANFGVGIDAIVDSDVFSKVTAENGQNVFSFLNGIAQKRGLLLSSSPAGNLLIQQANIDGEPVAEIEPGLAPLYPLSVDYDGEKRYSKFIAIGQGRARNNYKSSVSDTSIPIYKPLVFTSDDNEAGNIGKAAQTKKSRSLVESFSVGITLAGWRDRNGYLFRENTIILLRAPGVMIYEYTRFLVAGITFKLTNDGDRSVELRLVMPEAYTLEFPEKFPWEEN